MSETRDRLPFAQVLAFSGIGIPLAAVGLPMAVFVAPMYADELGLGTTLTGLIFMVLRFWDLGTDPVMGWLVDTKPTRFGRVKHWIAMSVPVLALAAFFLFMPPGDSVSPLYLIFCLGALWLGYTMLQTPHQSWVPMITRTYDERSRLFMWREVLSTGTLLALLIVPTVLAIFYNVDRRGQVMVMGIILIIALPLTVGLALRFVPDPPPAPGDEIPKFSWPLVWAAFQDPAIVRIFMVEILVGIAIAGTGGTFLFAAEWGFGVDGLAPVILLAFFVSGFACMPFWIGLSKRTEKHTALRAVCLFSAVAYFVYLPLSAIGGAGVLLLAALVSGIGYGTPFILVRSMMADVIEREQARSGDSRAGLYYSMMSGAYKTGASFAIGIPYILLGALVGFNPTTDNSPETVRGLMYVFVGVPVVAYAAAAVFMRGYPLTRKDQEEAAAKLATAAAE